MASSKIKKLGRGGGHKFSTLSLVLPRQGEGMALVRLKE